MVRAPRTSPARRGAAGSERLPSRLADAVTAHHDLLTCDPEPDAVAAALTGAILHVFPGVATDLTPVRAATPALLSPSARLMSAPVTGLAGHPLMVRVSSAVAGAFTAADLTLVILLADAATSRLTAAAPRERSSVDARLHAAQQLTGLAWWELDPRTGRHQWSPEMFDLLGIEVRDEPPTLPEYLNLVHPQDRKAAADLQCRGFDTGHQDVFRVVRPDGVVRHLQSWTDVERDEHGVVQRVVGAAIDVTEREETLRSLAASQAGLAAALELTRTATWEWDVRTDAVVWSDRMLTLMGRPPEDPPPVLEDFLTTVHPGDRARIRDLGERTIANGCGEETAYRVRHADGTVRHVRAWTDVRKDTHGQVTHLWGTAMDVTGHAEQANLLQASEEYFRVAFENAPIGMSMIDLSGDGERSGRYLRVNAAFEAMLGRTAEELRGLDILTITHPADHEADTQTLARLVRGETSTAAFHKRYLHSNGSTVDAWITSSVVLDLDGSPRFLLTHALDISDRLREQAELQRLALTDTLTGLANRTLLNDRMDQAMARLSRGGTAAMLLLDVDRFKGINDSWGHQVGDALLVEIATRIEAVSRADTTVARLGGDEFVVLIENLPDVYAVHEAAKRLIETLRRPYDLGPGAEGVPVTVSIGIAVVQDPTRTPGELYRQADLALYRAKDAGRDQYTLFDDELRQQTDRRIAAELLLRRALTEDLIVPVYQPVVQLSTGRVRSAEALVRIRGDDGRLILPAEFIEVAEDTGLIVEVDARMMERSVAAVARLIADGHPLRRMNVNVSPRSLEDPAYVDRVRKALVWHGIPGSAIRLEITERSLLTTSATVAESLGRINELGIFVGLDDFGTGYSAVAYLQRFSLHFLKIDRSFVSRLGRSSRDDAVVAAVIDLAHSHELVVVGEGVETREQFDTLRKLGCDWAQGYLMGRPMLLPDLVELIRADPLW